MCGAEIPSMFLPVLRADFIQNGPGVFRRHLKPLPVHAASWRPSWRYWRFDARGNQDKGFQAYGGVGRSREPTDQASFLHCQGQGQGIARKLHVSLPGVV